MGGWKKAVVAVACALLVAGSSAWAAAHEVELDTSTAEAVLEALANPRLTEAEARRIAALPANRALVTKMLIYSPAADADRFVAELLAAARREPLRDRAWYRFEEVRNDRNAVLRTLAALKGDLAGNAQWVSERLEAFNPPGPSRRLRGYLIAGGRPTGFTLGGDDFYLNLARFRDEPIAARVIVAHELFHSVQSAALRDRGRARDDRDPAQLSFDTLAARHNHIVRSYLTNMMDEGLATYVGDPVLLTENGRFSTSTREKYEAHLSRPELLTGLLEVLLVAMTAERPASYDAAYGAGFYGSDSPMYSLGYLMARRIAEKRGNQRLRELVVGTGCEFVNEYLSLVREHPDLEPLRPETLRLVEQAC